MSSNRCVRVTLCQINPTMGAFGDNAKLMVKGIAGAREEGAEIVVFPRLALLGGAPGDLADSNAFVQGCVQAAKTVAEASDGLIVIFGSLVVHEGEPAEGAIVCQNGQIFQECHFGPLPSPRALGKPPLGHAAHFFSARMADQVVTFWLTNRGPAFPDQLSDYGDFIVNLSAVPYTGEATRFCDLRVWAYNSAATLVDVGLVGGQDELVFCGGSQVYGDQGQALGKPILFQSAALLCDIPAGQNSLETPLDSPFHELAPIKGQDKTEFGCRDTELWESNGCSIVETTQACICGITDYVRQNGFTDVVLGISGGVDSALCAALSVEALGAEHVHGIYMPSRYSSDLSSEQAIMLCHNLGIEVHEIAIEKARQVYDELLAAPFTGLSCDVTEENLQARMRALLVMAFSNKFGYLALCTGNKSETACGYSTMYGDGAGGLAPIKDLFKGEVYEMCRYLNQCAGRELIPEQTLTRAPSAELRPNQKDSDSLPDYDTLDRILSYYLNSHWSREQIVGRGFDEKVVERVLRLVMVNEFKRRQGPIGIKLSPALLGFDRVTPITNHFRE